VFATRGFTAATVADVVAGSGASVGSIYHHFGFGGKNELFLAIFERMAAPSTAASKRRCGTPARAPTRPYVSAFRSWMAVLELDKSLRGQLLSRTLVATTAESSDGCGVRGSRRCAGPHRRHDRVD
jgi:AcrR family transcriptional regulator